MSEFEALDRLLAERQADRLPSVAAAVVRNGEIVWANAIGMADYEHGADCEAEHAVPHRLDHEDVHGNGGHAAPRRGPARPRRPARAASGRGRERLADDPAPALPPLRAAARGGRDVRHRRVADGRASSSSRWRRSSSCFAPAKQHHYSNLAFALLGQLVARKREQPYTEVVDELIIRPLGLERTTWAPSSPKAQGYLVDEYARTVWTRARDRPRRHVAGRPALVDGRGSLPLGDVPRGRPRRRAAGRRGRGDVVPAGHVLPPRLGARLGARPAAAQPARRDLRRSRRRDGRATSQACSSTVRRRPARPR